MTKGKIAWPAIGSPEYENVALRAENSVLREQVARLEKVEYWREWAMRQIMDLALASPDLRIAAFLAAVEKAQDCDPALLNLLRETR